MGWNANVHMECDECGDDDDVEFNRSGDLNSTFESVIENEGWYWSNSLSDKLLCPECAAKEG